MPIPQFTMPRVGDDEGTLRTRFIKETHAFLNYIVVGDNEDRWQGLRPDQFPFLHQAWEEVAFTFWELEERLVQIESSEIHRHGLGGGQLKFKLANVARWSRRLGETDRTVLPQRWKKYIQHLLDSINNLLKSILDAVGAGSAIQEMKDAIKDAIKWLFDD